MIITQLYARKANIIFISNNIEYSEVKIAVITQSIRCYLLPNLLKAPRLFLCTEELFNYFQPINISAL